MLLKTTNTETRIKNNWYTNVKIYNVSFWRQMVMRFQNGGTYPAMFMEHRAWKANID